MRLTMDDIIKNRKRGIRARSRARRLSTNLPSSKPRSKAETRTLVRITVNRVKKAIASGVWDISRLKTERRIKVNVGGN